MKKVVDFLNKCGVFFLATSHNNIPEVRPFGAIMEYGGNLFVSTDTGKEVYKQICDNSAVQIVALIHGTREWIRVCGSAFEEKNINIKTKMPEKCPILLNHYESATANGFVVIRITNLTVFYK